MFQSPSSITVFLQTAVYVRVTDGLGTQTNMAGKDRCQEMLARGNIEGYYESNLTFPLLEVLFSPYHSLGGATAGGHDVGVFLAH